MLLSLNICDNLSVYDENSYLMMSNPLIFSHVCNNCYTSFTYDS